MHDPAFEQRPPDAEPRSGLIGIALTYSMNSCGEAVSFGAVEYAISLASDSALIGLAEPGG